MAPSFNQLDRNREKVYHLMLKVCVAVMHGIVYQFRGIEEECAGVKRSCRNDKVHRTS